MSKTFSIRVLFALITMVAIGLYFYLPVVVKVRVDEVFTYGFCAATEGEEIYFCKDHLDKSNVLLPCQFVEIDDVRHLATLKMTRVNSFGITKNHPYDFSFEQESCIWHFPDEVEPED